jgi:hypothetical protein
MQGAFYHGATVGEISERFGVHPNVAEHSFRTNVGLIHDKDAFEAEGVRDREFLVGEEGPSIIATDLVPAEIDEQIAIAVFEFGDNAGVDFQDGLRVDGDIDIKAGSSEQRFHLSSDISFVRLLPATQENSALHTDSIGMRTKRKPGGLLR